MATSPISFTNTPQAGDDTFSYSESLLKQQLAGGTTLTMDVMANDLGGKAKSLWSLDDGVDQFGNPVGAGELWGALKDADTGWVKTAEGNQVKIVNGKIQIDLSGGLLANGASIDALGSGETYTDSFVYTIRLANGTLSYAKVNFSVAGENDGVLLATNPATDLNANVIEDTHPADSGRFYFSDADTNDVHSVSVQNDGAGTYGSLSASVNELTKEVSWNYTLGAGAQALAENEPAVETFTVTVSDGHGGTLTQTVTVNILGTNDPVVLVNNPATDLAASVTEDDTQTDAGAFFFSDVDASDTHSVSIQNDGVGAHGTLTASVDEATGAVNWSYALDNAAAQAMGADDTASETFTVTVADGHGGSLTQTVTVNIVGANDPVVLVNNPATDVAGSVTEDTTLTDSGAFYFSDKDTSDAHSLAISNDGAGQYGSIAAVVDEATGKVDWTYTLNNTAAQSLGANDHITESFDVTVSDGHGGSAVQTITVSVNGANEPLPAFAPTPTEVTTGDPNDFDSLYNATTTTASGGGAITGGASADALYGSSDADVINGGNGNDSIYADSGNDQVNGNNDADSLYGQVGNDAINGANGADTVFGGSGDDNIQGGSGVDVIYGGSGRDVIVGDGDADRIIGGYGADRLTGSDGADTFVFLSSSDTGDTITDFNALAGGDRLDFSALDAGDLTISTTGLAAHSVFYASETQAGQAGVHMQVDTDGNAATAELDLFLIGVNVANLDATDFIL